MSTFKLLGLTSICIAAIALTIVLIDPSKLAQSAAVLFSSTGTELYAKCIQTFSTEKVSSFTVQEARINEDAIDDAIISYTTNADCGSAGCIFELCVSNGDSYTHVPFGYASQVLTVKETTTNSMRDLMLNNDENMEMTWNGQSYVLSSN